MKVYVSKRIDSTIPSAMVMSSLLASRPCHTLTKY
jgi:hypothetical protein